MKPQRLRPDDVLARLVGVLLFAGFTALYFVTRTGVHTFDALSYTQDVRSKPFSELYHPHHLLYAPAGRLAVDLARTLGYSGAVDVPIQALNAVAGGLGVLLLWLFGARLSGRRWLSLPIAMLIGLCYAYWFYATEVEVYTLAAVFIILAMLALWRLAALPSRWGVIWLGVASVGAIMFHQTNALFLLPVSAFLLLTPPLRRLLIPYGLLVAVLTGLPYLLVAYQGGLRDADSIYDWATGYAQTGEWGGYLSLEHRAALWAGLRNTISPDEAPAIAFYGLVVAAILWGWRRLPWGWRAFGMVWLLLYGAFFWWWEPWNIEFWIALLPLAAMWLFAALRDVQTRPEDASPLQSPSISQAGMSAVPAPKEKAAPRALARAIRPASFFFAAAAGLLALWLFNAHYQPIKTAADPQRDYYQQITRQLAPQLRQTDVVISRGNILDLYLDYYADHPPSQVVSMRELRQAGYDAWAVLNSRIAPAYATGNLVYIDAILLDEAQNETRNPFGLSESEITRLRDTFPIEAGISDQGANVFYRIGERLPPQTREWRFDRSLGGWVAFGALNPRFEGEAWCMDASPDPWLESPPLALPASTISQLAITLSWENGDATANAGQIFWRRAQDADLSETRSLRFPLQAGTHTYTVALGAASDWSGEIVALRLDPIQGGTGTVCLHTLVIQ